MPLRSAPERRRQLCDELRRRIAAGEPIDADSLLAEHPEAAGDADTAVDLILTEFNVRREAGESPDPAYWLIRYCQWADPLRERFKALGLLTPSAAPATALTVVDRRGAATPAGLPVLPPHDIGDEISRGGMGVVYHARDRTLGRDVALKVLRGGCLAARSERHRFYREARAAAGLNHPNIVPVIQCGTINGEDAFTMPLMTGGTLAAAFAQRRQVAETVALLLPVARAVAYLHGRGLIHRDLKPANVLLDAHGTPHVADFGLAWLRDGESLTRTGQPMGTLLYMSPEQTLGRPVTPATDVWSLGVMLYEALTGRRPFAGTALTLPRQIRQDAPARPSALRADVPAGLEAVVLRCLEKGAKGRYADAGELAAELERCVRGEAVRTPPPAPRPPRWFGGRAALTG
ncbi:MAG: serine/threonine-protein kinase, partial [Gemmataceae bacterium]